MFYRKIKNILFSCILFTCVQALGYKVTPVQDLATSRVNTLSDNADDIQKQLNNEARDSLKYAKPKTVWVLYFPSRHGPVTSSTASSIRYSSIRELKITNTPDELDNLAAYSKEMPYTGAFLSYFYTIDLLNNTNSQLHKGHKPHIEKIHHLNLTDDVPQAQNNKILQPQEVNHSKVSLKVPVHSESHKRLHESNKILNSDHSETFKSNNTNDIVKYVFDTIRKISTGNIKESNKIPDNNAYYNTKLLEPNINDWSYNNQSTWHLKYPACAGRFQSPVDIPFGGLLHTKPSRPMVFGNYHVVPKTMSLVQDGNTVTIMAVYPNSQRPFISGGAAHSRRYIFHSIAVRWPAEHTIGGLYFPMETQTFFYSVEYGSLGAAIKAAERDKMAILGVSNIYKFSNNNHAGLKEIVKAFSNTFYGETRLKPLPLQTLSPPLKEYAVYHGSLTTPPCAENVLWFVRARSSSITRDLVELFYECAVQKMIHISYFRAVQPLNDRKVYFFD